jgi:uncharacterized membrane-anchored protein
MLAIAPQTGTVFAVVMPYPESVLPTPLTVALTVICLAVVGLALYGIKRR